MFFWLLHLGLTMMGDSDGNGCGDCESHGDSNSDNDNADGSH